MAKPNNTELWDRLGTTDPKHTKPFKREGGFSGTAIKPIWVIRRMTEEFGPCGVGWGINEPHFQVVPGADGEVLVYCIVTVWHGDPAQTIPGVGGDKVVKKTKYGLMHDDEAFKKAYTDGVSNAVKYLGVSADVHMGMFDDSKYVASLRENPHVTRPEDIYDKFDAKFDGVVPAGNTNIKRKESRPLLEVLRAQLRRIDNIIDLDDWAYSKETLADAKNLLEDDRKILSGEIAQKRDSFVPSNILAAG